MIDDDLSVLNRVADEIRGYNFDVSWANDYSFVAHRNVGNEHIYGIIRKVKNLPFYQAYMIITEPLVVDLVSLVAAHRHLHWVVENREKIKEFVFVDVSGHENFSVNAIAQLKEKFG